MDNDDAWKEERPCRNNCKRTATIGYETCAPCRVLSRATMLPEGTRAALAGLGNKLTESNALPIERAIDEMVEARDRATLSVALLTGIETTTVRADGGVRCVIGRGDGDA